MHSPRSVVWVFAILAATGTNQLVAQLNAPGAFSDFTGCSHHTCTWVPWSDHRTFQKGKLNYTVDAEGDTGGDFVMRHGSRVLLRAALKDLSASVSVVWSENDKFFAVTWSDGGAIGGFHVRVFRVQDDDEIVELAAATETAWNKFKAHHWCETRGDNIQAYNWMPGSDDLVLVLSVYPTSDCGKDMGHTEAYVVEPATGKILQRWNLKRLNAYIRAHPEM